MADQREQIKQDLQKYAHQLKKFSADYHGDEKLRARIDGGDVMPLFEALNPDMTGQRPPEGMRVRVVTDTDQERYFVIPSDPSWMLRDSEMQSIAGGNAAAACMALFCVSTFAIGVVSGLSVNYDEPQ